MSGKDSIPTDHLVLAYLKSRGFTSAASHLSEQLNTAQADPSASAANRTFMSASALLGGMTGYIGDGSADVALWGLCDADPKRMTAAFAVFLGQAMNDEELRAVVAVSFVHTFISLVGSGFEEEGTDMLTSFGKVFSVPPLSDMVNECLHIKTVKDVAELNNSISSASELREKLRVAQSKLKDLERKRRLYLQQAQASPDVRSALESKLAEAAKDSSSVSKDLDEVTTSLSNVPLMTRLRSQRAHVVLSPASFALLMEILRDTSMSPMAAIVHSHMVLVVEENHSGPNLSLDDGLPFPVSNPPALKWGTPFPPDLRAALSHPKPPPVVPFPQYTGDDFNEGILRSFRMLAALEQHQLSQTTPDLPKKIEAPSPGADAYSEKGVFNPHICMACITRVGFRHNSANPRLPCLPGTVSKLSPLDGQRVAAGAADGTVRCWKFEVPTEKSEQEHELTVFPSHPGPIYSLSWLPDARTLLTTSNNATIRLHDTSIKGPSPNNGTSAALAVYKGHTPGTSVCDTAAAPSGYYFASAGGDGTGRIWCTDRAGPVRIMVGHQGCVNRVKWHDNCNYIATGGNDGFVRLWDVQSGNCVRLLKVGGGVEALAFSPAGDNLIAASDDGNVLCFDLGEGKRIWSSNKFNTDKHTSEAFYSPCGSAVAVSSNSGIDIYDARSGTGPPSITNKSQDYRSPVKEFTVHEGVADVLWTKGGVLLAVSK